MLMSVTTKSVPAKLRLVFVAQPSNIFLSNVPHMSPRRLLPIHLHTSVIITVYCVALRLLMEYKCRHRWRAAY